MTVPDLVVAGGGPAGLAAAVCGRIQGLEVVVLDTARPPIDKACGEGLMPDGADVLRQLGVEMNRVPSRPFRGIRYIDDELIAEGRFPGRPGLGVRRTELHLALVRRAEDLGVNLRWGTQVTGFSENGFHTDRGPVVGRWYLGADGRSSRVRKWAGLSGGPARRRRIGLRRHFEVTPWSDLVEVYWHDRCEAYVTPVGERTVGVAVLWEGPRSSFDDFLALFPSLQQRLAGAPVLSSDRGAGPLEQRCRRVASGRLALVGDASGYLDAITGEGLALAFHQARAAVAAMAAGDLRQYRRAHRRIVRFPLAVTRLLLEIEARPRLRRWVMGSLAGDPVMMSRFLSLKMRRAGPRWFGRDGLLPLAASTILRFG